MRFSVLLPERLAGCMRLRWLYGSYDFHIAICMTNAVHYKMDAHKLSPEKRFYYERFKALLQVIRAIKIDKFSKNYILFGQFTDSMRALVLYFLSLSAVFKPFQTIHNRKNYHSKTQSNYWYLPEIC